jgi:hypothetical protein
MQASETLAPPKILVIQNEFVTEMKLALEVAGLSRDDPDAIREQIAAVLENHGIKAAILDNQLDLAAAASIADALFDLEIPFVFAGTGDEPEFPEEIMARTMTQDLANLTVLGQSILGRPTYH